METLVFDFGKALVLSAVNSRPFRHISMRPKSKHHPEIWFEITKNGEVYVHGPDDIIPFDEAIPMEWRVGDVWEVKGF